MVNVSFENQEGIFFMKTLLIELGIPKNIKKVKKNLLFISGFGASSYNVTAKYLENIQILSPLPISHSVIFCPILLKRTHLKGKDVSSLL